MRLKLIFLALSLAACAKYTDATSPCFGRDGEPAVSRADVHPLPFATDPSKACDFEEIGHGR